MSKLSRNKGSSFERWCVNQIRDHLGYDCKRNLSQYQIKGEADILIPGWSIECKAYAKGKSGLHKPEWWEQCVQSSGRREPVLIYKLDYQEPRAVIFLSVISKDFKKSGMTCTISLQDWFYIVREKIS